MKKLLLLISLLFPIYCGAETLQPPLEFDDHAITENFREIYRTVDNLPIQISGDGDYCIDEPTFCLDPTNNQILLDSGTVTAPVLAAEDNTDMGIFFDEEGNRGIWFTVDGSSIARFSASGLDASLSKVITGDGTVSLPSFTFGDDLNTGFYREGADHFKAVVNGAIAQSWLTSSINFQIAGSPEAVLNATQFRPWTDNDMSCGANGSRWTAVWAVNGSIQTSRAKFKDDIRDIPPDIKVPKGIIYKWKRDRGKPSYQDRFGFLAENLPEEAYYVDEETGERNMDNVYTNAIVGILCAKINELERRIEELEKND